MPSLVEEHAIASLEHDATRRLRVPRRVEPPAATPVHPDALPPAIDDDALPLDPAVLLALNESPRRERAQPLLTVALTVANCLLAVYNLVTLVVLAR